MLNQRNGNNQQPIEKYTIIFEANGTAGANGTHKYCKWRMYNNMKGTPARK